MPGKTSRDFFADGLRGSGFFLVGEFNGGVVLRGRHHTHHAAPAERRSDSWKRHATLLDPLLAGLFRFLLSTLWMAP